MSSAEIPPSILKVSFFPPRSRINPTFWNSLYDLKINKMKLSEEEVNISGRLAADLFLDEFSFTLSDVKDKKTQIQVPGKLLNLNTIGSFQSIDKKSILEKVAKEIFASILSGEAISKTHLLFQYFLLTFGDLKIFKYHFWYCSPVILPEIPFEFVSPVVLLKKSKHSNIVDTLYHNIFRYFSSSENYSPHLFMLINDGENSQKIVSVEEGWKLRFSSDSFFIVLDSDYSSQSSSSLNSVIGESEKDVGNVSFGWSMRNVLSLIAIHKKNHKSNVESVENVNNSNELSCNIISLRGAIVKKYFESFDDNKDETKEVAKISEFINSLSSNDIDLSKEYFPLGDLSNYKPKSVGWELNDKARPGPRVCDMSSFSTHSSAQSAASLLRQAARLNLSLMRWRQWPALDLEAVAGARCLLLGAGTLGCAVARALLGWGVGKITMLDSGRVAYSNPTRQSLFEISDCQNRSFKAEAAVASLRRINPNIECTAIVASIPMPGHPASFTDSPNTGESSSTVELSSTELLDGLVRDHDVVFCLTDTRESRWLPTLLCATHDKILINSALGFDTFLVMRHGHGFSQNSNETKQQTELSKDAKADEKKDVYEDRDESKEEAKYMLENKSRLGCYFCNDVVAAIDSTRDRTLDQQCTVTRPGLAMMAGGLAVELMVNLLQSPLKNKHHASSRPGEPRLNRKDVEKEIEIEKEVEEEEEELAPIPHQIRGSLKSFSQITLSAACFDFCSACGWRVVRGYRAGGARMVAAACADSGGRFLEELSGITEQMSKVALDDFADFDEEDEEGKDDF